MKSYYLALGDSYTIGEAVDAEDSFPLQFERIWEETYDAELEVEILATTGWTTSDLLKAIDQHSFRSAYDFVTLLIGVNNQYQGLDFDLYRGEFIRLLNLAISFAKGQHDKVRVLSIPDYYFTPFGQTRPNASSISADLDRYNEYAEKICDSKNVRFLNITDITRAGIANPDLVASDDLHPSSTAYKAFADLLFSSV